MHAVEMQTRELFERIVSSKEAYESTVKALREENEEITLPPFEELREKLPEATFHLTPDMTELMKTILPLDSFVDSLLRKRRWSLAVIDDPKLGFITSDTPLLITAV
jgi:hypothetical protein